MFRLVLFRDKKGNKGLFYMIKIVIDKAVLERYKVFYFNKYPKRRKFPITSPVPQSINEWIYKKNYMVSKMKQDWKELVVWLIEELGYTNMKIERCRQYLTLYFDSHRRHDSDNYVPKFINDGLTASGVVVDDDFEHITYLGVEGFVDMENPRTEIVLEILE